METWQRDRIGSAINGTNPTVMTELKGGYAAFGDTQFLPGYCLLLPKRKVFTLNDLNMSERKHFLVDMSILGDVILKVCPATRINYDLLGNTDKFLHAHVFPRYTNEGPKRLKLPVWLYSSDHWANPKFSWKQKKYQAVRGQITNCLVKYKQNKSL